MGGVEEYFRMPLAKKALGSCLPARQPPRSWPQLIDIIFHRLLQIIASASSSVNILSADLACLFSLYDC
jgi:hypothetical protein